MGIQSDVGYDLTTGELLINPEGLALASHTISGNITLPNGKNALAIGSITINNSGDIIVPNGSILMVL